MTALRSLLCAAILALSAAPAMAQDGPRLFQVPEGCTPFPDGAVALLPRVASLDL
jgi:hypothetical protein